MRLLDKTEVKIELRDLLNRTPVQQTIRRGKIVPDQRSTLPHLMDILKRCAVQARIMKPGEPLEEDLPNRMMLGMAFEEFAVSLYPEMIWKPGEEIVEGVAMNADALSLYGGGRGPERLIIDDFKYTKIKVQEGDLILKKWIYMQQLRGYCKGYEARLGRLHCMHVDGDYKKRREPIYMRYLIEFSDQDVESTWRLVQANKPDQIGDDIPF